LVKQGADSLGAVFAALADPTRRAMLEQLARGALPIGKLSEPFDISAPGISKHLRVLEQSGLITRTRVGRITHCRLTERPFADASRWLAEHEAFWEQQFDSLAEYLQEAQCPLSSPEPERSRSGSRGTSTPRAKRSSMRGRRQKP
jgi:DNA-binding transcriptional ArsR family regulator